MAHGLGVIDRMPEVTRPPKSQHQTRFLTEGEIENLLAACRKSRNKAAAPLGWR
jgi:hypothetical protein